MTIADDFLAKATATAAAVSELTAKVEDSNAKTDTLILVATTTKDALVALQGQQAGGAVITAAQLAEVTAQMDNIIAAATASKVSITAQEAETDAAAGAVAP